MQTIAIAAVSSQTFSTTLNNVLYNFAIYYTQNGMCYDLSIGGLAVVTGQRIVTGWYLIPFTCYEQGNGNFFLLTENNTLPDYTQFGTTQILIWLTGTEISTAVAAGLASTPAIVPYAL